MKLYIGSAMLPQTSRKPLLAHVPSLPTYAEHDDSDFCSSSSSSSTTTTNASFNTTTIPATRSPQWSLFPFPDPKMNIQTPAHRRAPIFPQPSTRPGTGRPLPGSAAIASYARAEIRDLRSYQSAESIGRPRPFAIPYPDALPAVHREVPISPRGYHAPALISVPPRTSSRNSPEQRNMDHPTEMESMGGEPELMSPISAHRSRENSESSSYETNGTSPPASIPALQSKNEMYENDGMRPVSEADIDPGSFDLVAPQQSGPAQYSLETRSEQLFSREHLEIIFADPSLLLRFTAFLSADQPSSIPVLIYYLDALKALKAIAYSNAIAESLDPIPGYDFTTASLKPTANEALEERARRAFDIMVRNDLPAFITHTYIHTVSLSISRRICGTLPPQLREASEGLAEVFCLTDPSRPDNPIVFASEEFHRTTQYGMNYVIGRNCRFLQGPKTNPFSVQRLRDKVLAGEECYETFLNYRRDGSPFMNLLMVAPLCDSRGKIRYFIGAQVDVSGLVQECYDLESLKRLVVSTDYEASVAEGLIHDNDEGEQKKDEFQDLSEMLNMQELETVRRWGGRMHKEQQEEVRDSNGNTSNWHKPRILIHDASPDAIKKIRLTDRPSGKLSGIYENYLLVRPYPTLAILFASPSLRVPGILQSPFMNRIGGSPRVRDELTQALAGGRGVTAKIRWVTKHDPEGRNRWIHCTPLIGSNGAIGVWMIVLVDDERDDDGRKFRQAPPVDPRFGRRARMREDDEQSMRAGSLRNFAMAHGARESGVTDHYNPQRPSTSHSRGSDGRSTFSNGADFVIS